MNRRGFLKTGMTIVPMVGLPGLVFAAKLDPLATVIVNADVKWRFLVKGAKWHVTGLGSVNAAMISWNGWSKVYGSDAVIDMLEYVEP